MLTPKRLTPTQVFSESYAKRLSLRIKKEEKDEKEKKKGLPTKNSFLSFLLFAVPALAILYCLVEWALAQAT